MQGGRYVELHPLDTFLKVSDEPVARSDDGVDLRHGALVQLFPSSSRFDLFQFRCGDDGFV